MIAKLRGLVDSTGENWVIIDVTGVGYIVYCSRRMLAALPPIGTEVTIAVETEVREDAITLYGFSEPLERDWFHLMTRVQGVGSKLALSVLGVLAPADLANAIAAQDKSALTRVPGVGPKLAARLVNELKDKVGSLVMPAAAPAQAPPNATSASAPASQQADVVSALVNLGYRPADAHGAVAAALHELGADAEFDALFRAGLKALSS